MTPFPLLLCLLLFVNDDRGEQAAEPAAAEEDADADKGGSILVTSMAQSQKSLGSSNLHVRGSSFSESSSPQ